MSSIIKFGLKLNQLDKSKIIQGKNGPIYPLVVYVNDEPNQWNQNVTVSTDWTKEEREAGKKNDYVANGRVTKTDGVIVAVPYEGASQQSAPAVEEGVSDLPF